LCGVFNKRFFSVPSVSRRAVGLCILHAGNALRLC
jgi:hypothetical protein